MIFFPKFCRSSGGTLSVIFLSLPPSIGFIVPVYRLHAKIRKAQNPVSALNESNFSGYGILLIISGYRGYPSMGDPPKIHPEITLGNTYFPIIINSYRIV
jgi:hypothetical protein